MTLSFSKVDTKADYMVVTKLGQLHFKLLLLHIDLFVKILDMTKSTIAQYFSCFFSLKAGSPKTTGYRPWELAASHSVRKISPLLPQALSAPPKSHWFG